MQRSFSKERDDGRCLCVCAGRWLSTCGGLLPPPRAGEGGEGAPLALARVGFTATTLDATTLAPSGRAARAVLPRKRGRGRKEHPMSRAWMPLYWGDYLRDTRDLSTLQHGAYLLLIAHYWQHGGLPDDPRRLAAIAGVPHATWRRIAPAIAAKFGPGWRHGRIDTEIAKTERAI